MSSDESEVVEETGKEVYRVNDMPWRRDVEEEMQLIDRQRLLDREIFSRKGARPVTRIRDGNTSRRDAARGLPKSCYDKEWLKSAPESEVEKLEVSKKRFDWMVVRRAH